MRVDILCTLNIYLYIQVEKQELNEFELLEEAAAANCSLSSNSSTVLRILGKKQEQQRADVNNNVIRARQKLDGKGILLYSESVFILKQHA